MSIRSDRTENRPAHGVKKWVMGAFLAMVVAGPTVCRAQNQPLPRPANIPDVKLVPELRTIPVPHDRPLFNVQMVNASLLPQIGRAHV